MSAQDLEQRARELLPELPPMAMTIAGDDPDAGHWYRTEQMRDYATSAIVAALRQQPAPVDLEQFREAVECWGSHRRSGRGDPRVAAEAERLLALIDNAGKPPVCGTCGGRGWVDEGHEEDDGRMVSAIEDCPECTHQPAPVADDARMARALEWVRTAARGNVGEGDALRAALIESARKHLPAIEEAIAAYDPNCGARSVRVAERLDEYLEKEHGVRIGRQAAIAALTAARAQGVQS